MCERSAMFVDRHDPPGAGIDRVCPTPPRTSSPLVEGSYEVGISQKLTTTLFRYTVQETGALSTELRGR